MVMMDTDEWDEILLVTWVVLSKLTSLLVYEFIIIKIPKPNILFSLFSLSPTTFFYRRPFTFFALEKRKKCKHFFFYSLFASQPFRKPPNSGDKK